MNSSLKNSYTKTHFKKISEEIQFGTLIWRPFKVDHPIIDNERITIAVPEGGYFTESRYGGFMCQIIIPRGATLEPGVRSILNVHSRSGPTGITGMIDELPPPDWNCLAVVGKSNSGKSIKLKYIGDINREEYSRAMAEYAKFTDPLNRNGELPWHLSQDVIDAAIESVKIDCSGISKLRNISLKRMICIPRWEPTVGTTETSLYYDHVTIPAK